MNKINYQKELEKELEQIKQEYKVPRLLLHSCCAPCSSYCLEYLSQYFYITVFYYNPNIYPPEEYWKRTKEQQQFIQQFPTKYPVRFMEGSYEVERFAQTVKGYEQCEEGKERCYRCYRLRLLETGLIAKEQGFDYFTTTLSISPLKDASILNKIGQEIGQDLQVRYLTSDFKKKNGFKRSTELSNEYGMYRQNYCGCVFSMREQQ